MRSGSKKASGDHHESVPASRQPVFSSQRFDRGPANPASSVPASRQPVFSSQRFDRGPVNPASSLPTSRQPVFSSQRFDRGPVNPASSLPTARLQQFDRASVNAATRGTSAYNNDELIARLLNTTPSQIDRFGDAYGSQRLSSASVTELALTEAAFNPNDLLREGLDEWHDKSLSMQLLKRTQSVSASRRRFSFRNPSRTSSRFPFGFPSQARQDDSQLLVPDARLTAGRHRYNFDYGKPELGVVDGLDGSTLEISPEYASTLTAAPQETLIHLVMLYHQALVKNGFKEEAQNIADHISELESVDLEDMAMELFGIDLLLRDGLLKYLMSIQPYIPTIPSQVVRFKNVGFSRTVQLDAGYESIYTKAKETLKGPLKKSPLEKVTVLKEITGYFMPGTMTLIMGTPGSGISVISHVLSGRSNPAGSTTSGSITYNGRNVNEIKSQRLVSLVDSVDVHYSPLTVRETLEFARECSQYYRTQDFGAELKELVGDALKVGQDPKLETILSMMGLKRVALKPVGSALKPSITEAERHRLSVAEMLAGTYAVYLFDHLNKGMDDSVTFDLVTSIRIFTRVRATTAVASLVQPPQDVFDLFDRIILLDRGHVVYQGPRQDTLAYFESLGYIKPRQLTVPEFLEEVTTSDGAQYLQPGFPRLSIEGFVAAYKNADTYKDICRVVDSPDVMEQLWVQGSPPLGVNFTQSNLNNGDSIAGSSKTLVSFFDGKGGSLTDVSMNHTGVIHPGDEVVAVGGSMGMLNYIKSGDSTKDGVTLLDQSQDIVRLQLERPLDDEDEYSAQFSRDYVQDAWPEFKLLLKRDLKATWRNKLGLYIRAFQILILGFYVGFTFFRVHTEEDQLNMNLLRSVFFVSLLDMTLFNVGQLPGLMEERQIFYKQQGAHFFRPSSYLFAKVVGSLPFALAEATTWTMIVYFLSNLSVTDGGLHFWVFYLIICLSVLNGSALVRGLSSIAPDLVAANGMIGIMVAIYIIFAGFLMPRFEVPNYWIWAYYLDPLQWGITALMVNEFTSDSYSTLCRDVVDQRIKLPQCNGRPNDTVGHAYLARGQFYTGTHWIAISVFVLLGWFALWTLVALRGLTKVRHVPMAIITPSAVAKFIRKTESLIDRDVEGQGGLLKLSIAATPVVLSWHELSYDLMIPAIGRTLNVLSYVSGWAEPGEMVALLGASGSGKTTLLNCLAGRGLSSGRVGGQILVNGNPKIQAAFSRIAGYCEKLEAYSPYMTVREAVAFNCELQLGRSTTIEKRKAFVEEIITLMELRSIENTLVKSLGQSPLTLAEAFRLRVATELARNPSIIFMDNPTKNLDSRSALHLVKTLRRIVDTGRIIIAAMSLPSQRILTHFTSVEILKRGGETVYWGPVGKDGEHIKAYFQAIPGTPPCPPNTSIANYAVDVIGDGVVERKALKDYAFEYRINELALHNHIQLQRLRKGRGTLGPEISDTRFGSSYGTRAKNIFRKLQLYYWRNVSYSWGRLFSSVVTALLLGSIYFKQDTDTTAGMNVKAGALFISALLLAISNAQSVIPQVLINRVDFAREKSSRQFNLFLYMTSWSLGEVPYLAISTLIYCGIFCGMVNVAVDTAAHFFLYWFILFLLTLAITFLGMFLASASVLPQIAGTMVTIFVGFWVATSGIVVPKRKILPQFIWIFWTNPLQYSLSALTAIAFYCDVDKQECKNGGLNPSCEFAPLNAPSPCPLCTCQRLEDNPNRPFVWTTIKNARTLDYGFIPYCVLALFVFILVFRMLTFAAWRIRDSKKLKRH